MGNTLNAMLALDFDTAIPGHGGIMNRRDILNFRNQMESVRQRMAELIRAECRQTRLLSRSRIRG